MKKERIIVRTISVRPSAEAVAVTLSLLGRLEYPYTPEKVLKAVAAYYDLKVEKA